MATPIPALSGAEPLPQPPRLLTEDHHWPAAIAPPPLPAFQVLAVSLTALYYAADEDEANRLVSQALGALNLLDLCADLAPDVLDPDLAQAAHTLSRHYRQWLGAGVELGYYRANATHDQPLIDGDVALAERRLDVQVRGSAELLRRFYKAFLLVEEASRPNDAFLRAGVAWGLTPAVIELTHSRARFLCNGFPEVASDLALGRDSGATFEQLLNLAEIHRSGRRLHARPTARAAARGQPVWRESGQQAGTPGQVRPLPRGRRRGLGTPVDARRARGACAATQGPGTRRAAAGDRVRPLGSL